MRILGDLHMFEQNHGCNHNSISVGISPDGVVLMVPPMVGFSHPNELQDFLNAIQELVSEGFTNLGMDSGVSVANLMNYDDFNNIIDELDEEWRKKVAKDEP